MGKSSNAMNSLFGPVDRYTTILEQSAQILTNRYPQDELRVVFQSLPRRLIAVSPLVFCDALVRDLTGKFVPEEVLGALGMVCLHISTHDDIVDETPSERRQIGGLLYAGNIAALEGIRRLYEIGQRSVASILVDEVNRNHLLQQECLVRLWTNVPRNFEEYRQGIEHVVTFAAIGPRTALAIAERTDLTDQLRQFSAGCGVAYQLLDDVAESGQDTNLGYHSFPIQEGKPFSRSFAKVHEYLDLAERSLNSGWANSRQLLQHPRRFAQQLQAAMSSR